MHTRTQVAIIGAGPSGMLLSLLLRRQGIDTVVIEKRTRQYVEERIRAGLLEQGTVETLTEAGIGERLGREGIVHRGFNIAFDDHVHHIDLEGLAGKVVTIYGQSEIQHDLGIAHDAVGACMHYGAEDVSIENLVGRPRVSFTVNGAPIRIDCDFVAGCDGYHGVCRQSVPASALSTFERIYPFGWLGLMADVPPVAEELIYINHPDGFALCSMRSRTRSRHYLQCSLQDSVEQWSDERFWAELRKRLPESYRSNLVTGPAIEKSIAPLRSFVVEPMRFGQLFLVGDAAHIVPPTGAKGLNLAVADVRLLCQALLEYYRAGARASLDSYSERALAHVWRATRFSWWFTSITHRFADDGIGRKLQTAELRYIAQSPAAATSLAENYAGLT